MPADVLGEALFAILVADDRTLGYVLNASFPTTNSLVFQSSVGMDQRFFDSLSNKGYLPFHRWSLILVDAALRELRRYTWNQSRVREIRFSALDNQLPKPLRFTVHLDVMGVTQSNPNGNSATSSYVSGAQPDHGAGLFQLKIDGLDAAAWSVSKIGTFTVGVNGSDALVLTVSPEALADPFRDWLQNGNALRTGTLNCLSFGFQTYFRVRFAGLRVRTITPALSTNSSSSAAVHLTYSNINIGADS